MIAKEHENNNNNNKKKRTNKQTKKKYSVASQATMFRREINLPETLQPETEAPTIYTRKVKRKAKRQKSTEAKMGR